MRTYKRKTERVSNAKSQEIFLKASKEVLENKRSIRSVARDFDINFMTLRRFCQKIEKHDASMPFPTVGYKRNRQIFSDEKEQELAKYLEESSQMFYGVSTKEIRSLAYEFAIKNNVAVNQSWKDSRAASKEWMYAFVKRHKNLAIRTPEPTSLVRETSFNRESVNRFFDLLESLVDRYKFECYHVYNLDETEITSIQLPNKTLASKNVKSDEKDDIVTLEIAVNASGNTIPPMFVFPRKNYRGSANSSGWINQDGFFIFLQHFVKFTQCTKARPVLILLDNHDSHLSIRGIDFCKSNGIVILSFPPHTSHKLQPLDRAVYVPLKQSVNTSCDTWIRNNPKKTMSIYNIIKIVTDVLPLATKPNNIQSGFSVSGVWPINRNVFTDDDFLTSAVTVTSCPDTLFANEIINEETSDRDLLVETSSQAPLNDALSLPSISDPKSLQLESMQTDAKEIALQTV